MEKILKAANILENVAFSNPQMYGEIMPLVFRLRNYADRHKDLDMGTPEIQLKIF